MFEWVGGDKYIIVANAICKSFKILTLYSLLYKIKNLSYVY